MAHSHYAISSLRDALVLKRGMSLYRRKSSNVESKLKLNGKQMTGPGDIYVNPDSYSHCNIWGSGWSVLESLKTEYVVNSAFNIGFNFSCLNKLKYHLYFIENASADLANVIAAQAAALEQYVVPSRCPIILKNLWQEKNDADYAVDAYEDISVLFGRDLIIPHKSVTKKAFRRYALELIHEDDYYFRQACSTALTAITFAVNKGFKKIVVHGVDFGGGYFFDADEISVPSSVVPPVVNDVYDSRWRKKDAKHPTGGCLKMFLVELKSILSERDVSLVAGTIKSPVSEVLGIEQR